MAQRLSQQITEGTGYTKEKGAPKFLRYLYTFTMIPFFALLAPDHELPRVWLLTNTIKFISIPPLIFDAPLLLDISCPLNDLLTQNWGIWCISWTLLLLREKLEN
jgi:hypothetical protein